MKTKAEDGVLPLRVALDSQRHGLSLLLVAGPTNRFMSFGVTLVCIPTQCKEKPLRQNWDDC